MRKLFVLIVLTLTGASAQAADPSDAMSGTAMEEQHVAPQTANATTTPVGVWTTEKNEGRVRILPCGQNLCGYTVEGTGTKGRQVLIDMKPANGIWSGKIHDVKNGGIYLSNISLLGRNALRVEGCVLGGMFCGGQTWARLE